MHLCEKNICTSYAEFLNVAYTSCGAKEVFLVALKIDIISGSFLLRHHKIMMWKHDYELTLHYESVYPIITFWIAEVSEWQRRHSENECFMLQLVFMLVCFGIGLNILLHLIVNAEMSSIRFLEKAVKDGISHLGAVVWDYFKLCQSLINYHIF